MIVWVQKHPQARAEMLGMLPEMLDENDPRPAREQFNQRYTGGWDPFEGFKMAGNGDLIYSGDPPTKMLFEARLRDETIRLYEYEWVAIIQPNGSFEVCRMD